MTRKVSESVVATLASMALCNLAGAQATNTGLIRHDAGAFQGYTLFAPLSSTKTYLIDMAGRVVHTWTSDTPPGQAACLLDNGHLLRCARDPAVRSFHGGGLGGRIQELDWDSRLVWEFVYADDQHCQHHDIKPLPGGSVLVIAWEKKTEAEAIAAGRDPELAASGELWPDHLIEVQPQGQRGGKIVWQWHVWDHLVQDRDKTKANYGVVADHPELIDVNFQAFAVRMPPPEEQRLRSLGYVGGPPGPGPGDGAADWNHTNSIDYNPQLDQIVLSVLGFNEIWVIDHSTTTQEAAGHTGGKCGKGGDLLYRWGNPQTYGAGTAADQQLFAQHDAQWIPRGSPGAGDLLIFNNGRGRPEGDYSSVVEIVPPCDDAGRYARRMEEAFGPARPAWIYTSRNKADFFAGHISGAQRLPNGNTLICSGEQGRVFEVSAGGKTVWEYMNPYTERSGPERGFGLFGGGRGGRWFRDGTPGEGSREGSPASGDAGDRPRRDAGPTSRPQASGGADRREGQGSPDVATRSEGQNERPGVRRGLSGPPGYGPWGPSGGEPPAGGPWGPPGGGPGGFPGGGPGGGLFRATRLAADHPGVQRVLQAKSTNQDGETARSPGTK